MGINDDLFSIVNPAQVEEDVQIPKYNDAKYPNKLEYNFCRSDGNCQNVLPTYAGCSIEKNSTYYIPNSPPPNKCSVV